MNIVNIKKLQDTYAKIDEYKAKYRIHSRAYGWHFGGLQNQGWKIDGIIEPEISEDGYLKLNSDSIIVKLNPFDDKDPTNELYNWFSIAFKNINKTNGKLLIKIDYSETTIRQEIQIVDIKEDYLIQFAVIKRKPSNIEIKLENTDVCIGIKYIKFDKEFIVEADEIINIYDDETIYKFLSKEKKWNEKIIANQITTMYNEISAKQSDNGCSTCDVNTCTCDQEKYGYLSCTIDACKNFMPCTCNSSCHLQERNTCYCDQLFYDKNAIKENAKKAAAGGIIDLLLGSKPTLENLIIVNDSLDKYLLEKRQYNKLGEEEKANYKFKNTVKFRRKDNNKPGYINYEFGRDYRIKNPENNLVTLSGKYNIELESSASNDYTDLWNQLISEIENGDFCGYEKNKGYDNIQRHIYTKLISFKGTPYLIAWYPGGKDEDTDKWDYAYNLYHKLYKVEFKNNKYCLVKQLELKNTINSDSALSSHDLIVFDGLDKNRLVNVYIHEDNNNRLVYELVASGNWRNRYRANGRTHDVFFDMFCHEIEITDNGCKKLYSRTYSQINFSEYNRYYYFYDGVPKYGTSYGCFIPIKKQGNKRTYINTKKKNCKKNHLNQIITKKDDGHEILWKYFDSFIERDHYMTRQNINIKNPAYKTCSYLEFDNKMYVCAGKLIFGTTTNTKRNGSVKEHDSDYSGATGYLEMSPYYYGTVHSVYVDENVAEFGVNEQTLYSWFNNSYKTAKIIPYLISPQITISGAADNNAQHVTYRSDGVHTGIPGYTALDASAKSSGVSVTFSEITGYGTNIVTGTADRQLYINEMRIVRFHFDENIEKLYISVDNHLFSYDFNQSNDAISNEEEIITLSDDEQIIYIGHSNNKQFILYKKEKLRFFKYINEDPIQINADISSNVVYAFVDKFGNLYYETRDQYGVKSGKNYSSEYLDYTGINKEVKIGSNNTTNNGNNSVYNGAKIKIDSNIMEFKDYTLNGINEDFSADKKFTCTCDQTWYGISSCTCNSVVNNGYNSCVCYMNRY